MVSPMVGIPSTIEARDFAPMERFSLSLAFSKETPKVFDRLSIAVAIAPSSPEEA